MIGSKLLRSLFFVWFGVGWALTAMAEPAHKLLATGSSTVAPLMAELALRYEDQHPEVRLDVQTGGSSRGAADAMRGVVDMGMASRALKPSEQQLVATTIARDGVAVIVHSSNPIEHLSRDRIIGIYTDTINDWSEVGGSSGGIVVVNKAAGHSTLELFAHYLSLEPREMKPDIVIGDNQQGIKTVAGNPLAIGYVSIGAARHAADSGVPIKLLPMDGIEATMANVENGSYPINRPLNVLTRTQPEGEVKRFLEFALAQDQIDIVKSLNFVPVNVH